MQTPFIVLLDHLFLFVQSVQVNALLHRVLLK
jgi:hypothetical protein